MNKQTFKLIEEAAHHAERLIKLDPECWLNKLRGRIQVVVAVKGHHIKPQLLNRPSLSAQAVFGFYHRKRLQAEFPFNEASFEFRTLVAEWGGVFIKKPAKPSEVKSHQPKKRLDATKLFSVGASGGSKGENSMAAKLFTKVIRIFLARFDAENAGLYEMEDVLRFTEKTKVRLRKVRLVEIPLY